MNLNKKQNKKIIVFEGIDGVGKSTQARLLYFTLKKRGFSVDLHHFPSDGDIGIFIRYLLKNKKFDSLDEKSRALLTTADFYNQYSKKSSNAEIIIFDRYIYSSFVSNHKLDKEWINLLHKYAPEPNIVFFMTCDVDTIIKRSGIDFGAKNLLRQKDFYTRYKNTFKNIENIEIDANRDLRKIHEQILQKLKKILNI